MFDRRTKQFNKYIFISWRKYMHSFYEISSSHKARDREITKYYIFKQNTTATM